MSETIEYPCGVCLKEVTNRQHGALCKSKCNRWFHKDCAKIPPAEYSKLSSDENVIWNCRRADCSSPVTLGNNNDVLMEILKKIDTLSTKADLEPISHDIATLKDKVDLLSHNLSEITPRLNKVEEDVKFLLEENQKSNSVLSVDETFAEIADRTSRQSNAIIFNVPESNSSRPHDKKHHDLALINKIVSSAKLTPEKITFFRIGKSTAKTPRPIKILLTNSSEAREFFKGFSSDNMVSIDPSLSKVTISRDRTPKELTYLGNLRKSLQSRIENGETDLTIKFVNGTPKIVKRQQKN